VFLRKYGWAVIIFFATWMISFGLSFWLVKSVFWQDAVQKPLDQQNLEAGQTQVVGLIPQNTRVIEEIYYLKCQHLKKREILAAELPELSEQALKGQGWAVYHNNDHSITIFKNVDGLCPEDANKRHLGVSNGFVAIFEGPVGTPGKMLEVLDIKVERLPKEWQEKVKKGELNFSSEQELLEALDSIDEYE